jgi:hypothetical protein
MGLKESLMQRTENEFAEFWIQEGILYFIYKHGSVINLDAAKKIVAERLKLQAGVPYPVFCDLRGIRDSDKAARDYLAREGSELVKAVGALVESPVTKVMLNFYMKIDRPRTPTQMFTTKEDALLYLQAYIDRDIVQAP